MKKTALIIVNPVAGDNSGREYADKLKCRLDELDFKEIKIKETKEKGDATKIAKEEGPEFSAVFVIGGDGTVNESVAGLVSIEEEKRPILGVIPGGTFNAVTRMVDTNQNPEKAIEEFKIDSVEKMDIGVFGEKVFCLIFSIGDIPEGIHGVSNEEKARFKMLAYVVNIFKKLSKDSTYKLSFMIDDKEIEKKVSHIMVLTSSYLQGVRFTEYEIDKDDGFIHLIIVPKINFWTKLRILPSIISGSIDKFEKVEHFKAKNIKIESKEKNIEFDIEGDKGGELPVELNVKAGAIEIYRQK